MVGDFDSNILPLFYHYVEEMRVHVLLFDKRHSDKQHANSLAKGLENFCHYYDYAPEFIEISFDEDNIDSIRNAYSKVKSLAQADEAIYLNASDGLASTLAVMQPMLHQDGSTLLAYDRFENSCNILSGESMKQEVVSPMTIHEHLILKNIDYEFIDEDEEMHRRKRSVFSLMENTASYIEFREAIKNITPRHNLYWMYDELEHIGKARDKQFTDGGILEEYCYWLVKDLGFDDVKLGTKITHNPETDDAFKNELDVLMIKDNHMHTIECKLSKFLNGEQFIYKYDSVGNLLDADGKRMIVSVGGPNMKYDKYRKPKYQFNTGNIKRATQAKIVIYQEEKMNPEQFRAAVRNFFLGEELSEQATSDNQSLLQKLSSVFKVS